ncbi:MAG TPA: F0F1 ATP synthase subunit A [Solirubrobacteraceae bacterium]|nr:F0F1 ATP synthase subunit A [Solirubrobacteraceae bacterium]
MTSRRNLVLIVLLVWLVPAVLLGVIFGSDGRNEAFQPTEEFRLDDWIDLGLLSINKAVFYLFVACLLTAVTVLYIANKMTQRPNRVQTAVETLYTFMRDNLARGNMDEAMARKWFPFCGTLFLFIWFSNLIGYIPLPTNTHEKFDLFGLEIPSFALYAATANISVPLVLTLMVWFAYHFEGIRVQGPVKYLKSWVPAGVSGPAAGPIFVIEVISHFVRIISLSVRLFANILAGHLLILFMAGGLGVILGLSALGWITLPIAIAFFLFEVGLVATLQAFIFATLTAIYLGGATSEHH